MMRFLCLLFATCLAGPALALSCVRPDVAHTFQRAAEASEVYVVVHVTLTFDQAHVPESGLIKRHLPQLTFPARLEGKSLSDDGFVTAFNRDISLVFQCIGEWCGEATSGAEYLAFLESTSAGYVMTVDPCWSLIFFEPSKAQLDQASSCMREERCIPVQ